MGTLLVNKTTLETKSFDAEVTTNLVNSGFQKPGRAKSYNATQKYIVDKTPLLDKAISLIEEKERLKVIEFGIGTGTVLMYMAERGLLRKLKDLVYTGLDLSPYMINYAVNMIDEQRKIGNIREDSKFMLSSGINLVNPSFATSWMLPEESYDLVICSQFEHYFPNGYNSKLACKLKKDFMTKKEFRINSHKLLKNKGRYIVLDDRVAEQGQDSCEQRELDYAWDKSVALNFLDQKVVEDIAINDPETADKIRKSYDPKRPLEESIKQISRVRIRRRKECNEELETLSQTLDDFRGIYGNAGYEIHPSLRNFYLAWAVKDNGL